MPKSKEYTRLCEQLNYLRAVFLPVRFDSIGVYDDKVKRKALAFRILAHAEFESYFEDRVWEIALGALRSWKNQKKNSNVLLALLAFSGIMMELPPQVIVPTQDSQIKNWNEKISLEKKIESAVNAFKYSLEGNHGVKEEHLLKLLLPIGFPIDKLDDTWLADMSSFGKRRGQAVHKTGISHEPNPQDELKTVTKLLKGIKEVNVELDSLMALYEIKAQTVSTAADA